MNYTEAIVLLSRVVFLMINAKGPDKITELQQPLSFTFSLSFFLPSSFRPAAYFLARVLAQIREEKNTKSEES